MQKPSHKSLYQVTDCKTKLNRLDYDNDMSIIFHINHGVFIKDISKEISLSNYNLQLVTSSRNKIF